MSPNRRNYQREVWHLISHFQAFNIIFVPRIRNAIVDTLANVVARFSPLRDGFSVHIIYRSFIPNNITNFHIFNEDQQILNFMMNTNVFKDVAINEDEHEKEL